MAAYAASARIVEVHPYRTSRRDAVSGAAPRIVEAAPAREDGVVEFDGHDAAGRSWTDILVDWTETTFFLFSPQSWR